jgi:hypothetical protein
VTDKAKICERIPASELANAEWEIKQGTTNAKIIKIANVDEYELTLRGQPKISVGPCQLVEPIATEVYNVALVQKGGPSNGSTGLREAAIYKEYVSHIDFIGKGDYDPFYGRKGKGRKIEIHKEKSRTVLPTAGSRDLLGGTANQGSEVNKLGIGGGGVFMVDGITFGLEVCRDHYLNRLANFYKDTSGAATSGDPRVQVALIPFLGNRNQ